MTDLFNLYERLDAAFTQGRFDDVDAELGDVDFDSLSATMGLGWLCACRPARSWLSNYPEAVRRFRAAMTARRRPDVDDLLRGLE